MLFGDYGNLAAASAQFREERWRTRGVVDWGQVLGTPKVYLLGKSGIK